MKALILTALLATTGCQAVPVAFGVFKGSQMLNEARGGKPSETLTEADYNACKAGDEAACNRCFGYSVFLGAFHCTMMHPIHNALPTISDTDRTEYGGANYYAMPKGRGR